MKTKAALFALALLGSTAVFSQSTAPTPPATPGQGRMGSLQGGGGEMHRMMRESMNDMMSMPTTGETDRDFAMMMKRHHQGGLEMAEHQVKNGKDAELKKIARKIADDQKKEIAELDRWLASHGGTGKGATKEGKEDKAGR